MSRRAYAQHPPSHLVSRSSLMLICSSQQEAAISTVRPRMTLFLVLVGISPRILSQTAEGLIENSIIRSLLESAWKFVRASTRASIGSM